MFLHFFYEMFARFSVYFPCFAVSSNTYTYATNSLHFARQRFCCMSRGKERERKKIRLIILRAHQSRIVCTYTIYIKVEKKTFEVWNAIEPPRRVYLEKNLSRECPIPIIREFARIFEYCSYPVGP
jgi:hypothetical protein